MSAERLVVDPTALTTAGAVFDQQGSQLAGLGADAPLGDAASAVPDLQTATACRDAQSAVQSDVAATAAAVSSYGTNLAVAANRYGAQDQAAAESIGATELSCG